MSTAIDARVVALFLPPAAGRAPPEATRINEAHNALERLARKALRYDSLMLRMLDSPEPPMQELALKVIREAGQP